MSKKPKTEPEEAKKPLEEEPVEEAPEETAEAPAEESESPAPQEDPTEALGKKLAEMNDRYLRTLAEYDNFRRRSQKEKDALYGDTKAETIAKFLPVIDNFERAAAAEGDFESYKKGVEMTVGQLKDVLKSLGAEAFGEKGEPFDPKLHNGVMHEENDELGENTVSDVFLKGYKMGDKIIRHATVKVAN